MVPLGTLKHKCLGTAWKDNLIVGVITLAAQVAPFTKRQHKWQITAFKYSRLSALNTKVSPFTGSPCGINKSVKFHLMHIRPQLR